MLYLDHAATGLPRMPGVAEAMTAALGLGNPGRSGHETSREAARVVFEARERLASMFGVGDSRRVIFTPGCTQAINMVIAGRLRDGDRVVTTVMEHNAVARPLAARAGKGMIRLVRAEADAEGCVDPALFGRMVREEATALAVVNHASNVCGAVQDLCAIRAAIGDVPLLVDGAQSAGHLTLDVDGMGIDYLALAGHKGLGGPPGIGALLLGPDAVVPQPLVAGGTGSRSDQDLQPDFLPDRLEAGTQNLPGIAGLGAALAWLSESGPQSKQRLERQMKFFIDRIADVPGVELLGPPGTEERVPVFGLRFLKKDPGEVARILEREHGILVRSGLHCAPWAHQALGSFPGGLVRVSFGVTGSEDEAERALEALRAVA